MNALTLSIIVSGIAALASIVYTTYETIRIKNNMKRNKEYAEILSKMLEVERDYFNLVTDEYIDNFDKVHKYILQNTYLLDKCNLQIDLSKFIVQEAKYSDMEFRKFLNQLQRCPKKVKEIALKRNNVVEKVVRLKRPYYYQAICLKKRIILQMMSILLEILVIVSKFIPKYIKIRDRSKLWQDSDKVLDRVADVNRTILTN